MNKLIVTAFNFTLFNNTNTTAQDNLSPEMKVFFDTALIRLAEPNLVHQRYGQKRNIPKNGGKTIEFRCFDSLPTITTDLQEGITPNGQVLSVTSKTAEIRQIGGYVEISDQLDMTAKDPIMVEATHQISGQAGRSIDTVVRDVLNTCTNVQYADGSVEAIDDLVGGETTGNHYMTLDCIREAVNTLKRNNAEPFEEGYVAIVHPDVLKDLKNDPKWEEPHKYKDTENIYNGEIGRLDGVTFVETTNAKIYAGAGANGRNVYSTMVIANNAYGVTEVQGGGLQHIVKQLGSAGSADPLNQRATVGWKAMITAEILVPQYMVKLLTTASHKQVATT